MKIFHVLLLFSALVLPCPAEQTTNVPVRHEWTVDGITREALIYAPPSATNQATPVVFAFHGHGGTMTNAAHMFPIPKLWPDAIVVYMQGVNTPGRLTDPDGKVPGWQIAIGDHDDRDLKFFDTVLAGLKHDYRVDEKRVFATGHSNGGAFTYLLWAARGDQFAAMAPSSSIAVPSQLPLLKPKPAFHVAGENDPLVKFAWQKQMMDHLRKLNQCGEGEPSWENEKFCTLYPSKIGAPLVTFVHPGKHVFPPKAAPLIVKFFQQHPKP